MLCSFTIICLLFHHMALLLVPRWFLSLLLLLHFLLSSSGSNVVTVNVAAAKGLIHTGYLYLDVRTVQEFRKGHVDAANIINIPYMLDTPNGRLKNPDFLKEVSSVCNKQDHLIVGCQSGVRSLYATTDLVADGYKNVKDMGGGYMEWVKSKFPVKSSLQKEEEL